MATHIDSRTLKDGKTRRHDVRYRRGGRGYRLERAGSFATLKEAQARQALVADWIARGLNPRIEIARLQQPATRSRTLGSIVEPYVRSRIDVSDGTLNNYRSLAKRITAYFGNADIHELTPSDCAGWIVSMHEEGISPGTLKQYRSMLRHLFDFGLPADAANPARHRSVKLPRGRSRIVEPPDADDFLALLAALPEKPGKRWRSAALMLEQTGMRHGEMIALEERDIDRPGLRLRVRPEVAKTSQPRWIPVEAWYMEILEPVGRGLSPDSLANAMSYHCDRVGIPHIHPHLLRHRRATLWHQGGIYATELASRLGHAKVSESLDTYSHVRPISEADPSRILQVLGQEPFHVDAADEEAADTGDLLLRDLADDRLGHGSLDAHLLHEAAGIQ